MKKKKIVVIGGGTGTTAVLSGLKQYADLDISVIVSMTDDGGSNAVVRDEFGLLPLSDLRKSIIALAKSDNALLRDIFTYRFAKGNGLSGHTLGNLIMMALSDMKGSEVKALEAISHLFQVGGKIIPVTLKQTTLKATYDSGETVLGEHLIDEPDFLSERHIAQLSLEPFVSANLVAIKAITEADMIIAGPGDLYTSTFANIIVSGVARAIKNSSAQFVFISNLMTKQGQTHDMTASDIVGEVIKYTKRIPDVVVLHRGEFSPTLRRKYAKNGEFPIVDDLGQRQPYKIIRASLTGNEIKRQAGDTLVRSLIRHDSRKIGRLVYRLIQRI